MTFHTQPENCPFPLASSSLRNISKGSKVLRWLLRRSAAIASRAKGHDECAIIEKAGPTEHTTATEATDGDGGHGGV